MNTTPDEILPQAKFFPNGSPGATTLEVTQWQILSQSPADATRFWWHVYGRWLKKLSICPWVASREEGERHSA